MTEERKQGKSPWLMRRVPFFLLAALCGPLALVVLMIYWRDTPSSERGPYFFFAFVFTMFFITKVMPDGLLQIILFSATYTLILFVTYAVLGRKRKRKSDQ